MLHMHFLIRQLSTFLSPNSNKNKQTPSSCCSGESIGDEPKVEGSTPFRNDCDDAYRRNITFFYICQKFIKNLDFLYFFLKKYFYFKLWFWKIMIFCTCFFAIYACENNFVTDWQSSIQCIKRKKSHEKSVFFRL